MFSFLDYLSPVFAFLEEGNHSGHHLLSAGSLILVRSRSTISKLKNLSDSLVLFSFPVFDCHHKLEMR